MLAQPGGLPPLVEPEIASPVSSAKPARALPTGLPPLPSGSHPPPVQLEPERKPSGGAQPGAEREPPLNGETIATSPEPLADAAASGCEQTARSSKRACVAVAGADDLGAAASVQQQALQPVAKSSKRAATDAPHAGSPSAAGGTGPSTECGASAPHVPPSVDAEVSENPGDWILNIHPSSQILFEKKLTHSDTNRLGRMVLPKSHAEQHFNDLDGHTGVPIVVGDIFGRQWSFKYRWWPNNNSKMYLLEGIHAFIRAGGFQAGDIFVLAVCPKGSFQVGGRKGVPTAAAPARGTGPKTAPIPRHQAASTSLPTPQRPRPPPAAGAMRATVVFDSDPNTHFPNPFPSSVSPAFPLHMPTQRLTHSFTYGQRAPQPMDVDNMLRQAPPLHPLPPHPTHSLAETDFGPSGHRAVAPPSARPAQSAASSAFHAAFLSASAFLPDSPGDDGDVPQPSLGSPFAAAPPEPFEEPAMHGDPNVSDRSRFWPNVASDEIHLLFEMQLGTSDVDQVRVTNNS
ncbi:hypothetical protein T492DRAFT_537729 [Pavlovales sp. CCMP2436]|nr:hypothetical protein T492DRAFT_537729 [Pavlovales sp. CCMP2436]